MKRIITKNWLPLMATFLIAFSLTLVGAQVAKTFIRNSRPQVDDSSSEEKPTETPETPEPAIPSFIDLQSLVDEWANTTEKSGRNRKVGVMIYDLDNNRIAGEHNANEVFNSASIYKLFFAYDGYRQIDNGKKIANELFVNTSDKGRLTYSECLDLIIRESYNPCADPMRADDETYDRIDSFIQDDLKLKNTSDAGLYSTPADLAKLLQYLYHHEDLTKESWEKLADSMLNQPQTTYDWRQGLPAGFNRTIVYDKVGWRETQNSWAEYNDAAILYFPEQNRHYAIVVMTENLPNTSAIVELGNKIETAILTANQN